MSGLSRAVLAVVLACGVAACAGERSPRFSGEFDRIEPTEAPEVVQALHGEVGRLAGFHQLEVNGETYLLLCAGRRNEGGRLEVLELGRPGGSDREVRVLAVLRPGSEAYPCAFIRTETTEGISFKARLSIGSEDVQEWRAEPAGR